MLISTEFSSLYRYGTNRQLIKLLKDSAFDAYDFNMCNKLTNDTFVHEDDYIKKAKEQRTFADSIGIICNQTHAPFPSVIIGNEEFNKNMFNLIVKAIEVSGILGAKYCVVHPCNDYNAQQNAEFYNKLLSYAKQNNVIIALENMYNWNAAASCAIKAACSSPADFVNHLDLLDSEWFAACLDIGHSEMQGLDTDNVSMIKALGKRLKAIHLHDNDKRYDLHGLPFIYNIDFKPVINALAESDYEGDITFETNHMRRHPLELYPQATAFMCQIGNYFKDEINRIKDKSIL